MSKNTKILLAGAGVLILSATVYLFSQDARRKKYNRRVVPLQYALDAMKKK